MLPCLAHSARRLLLRPVVCRALPPVLAVSVGTQTHVWWDMGDGQYMDCSGCPILFEGREPRDRGYPLPVDESEVGTPLQQWECELRMSSPEEWYQYRMNGWGW